MAAGTGRRLLFWSFVVGLVKATSFELKGGIAATNTSFEGLSFALGTAGQLPVGDLLKGFHNMMTLFTSIVIGRHMLTLHHVHSAHSPHAIHGRHSSFGFWLGLFGDHGCNSDEHAGHRRGVKQRALGDEHRIDDAIF